MEGAHDGARELSLPGRPRTNSSRSRMASHCIASLHGIANPYLPAQAKASLEYKLRTGAPRPPAALAVFEGPTRAVAVVDVRAQKGLPRFESVLTCPPTPPSQVARAWSGKPQLIQTVPTSPSEEPVQLPLDVPCGSAKTPIVCFKSAKAACQAKWLQLTPVDGSGLPRGTERMLALLQIGPTAGEGKDSVMKSSNGVLLCSTVRPIAVVPLPAEYAATAVPREAFFVPAKYSHALD